MFSHADNDSSRGVPLEAWFYRDVVVYVQFTASALHIKLRSLKSVDAAGAHSKSNLPDYKQEELELQARHWPSTYHRHTAYQYLVGLVGTKQAESHADALSVQFQAANPLAPLVA